MSAGNEHAPHYRHSADERDEEFAPVLRDEDERTAADDDRARGREVSGTGVPGAPADHPDALPPTPEGVREAERGDDTGDTGWTSRPGTEHPRD